jgi:phytoene/squalene synthetase
MQFEVERARALMHSGAPLALRLPGRVGWELRLVIQGGLRILERIEQAGYDVFRRRPSLGRADWLIMLGRALRMRA